MNNPVLPNQEVQETSAPCGLGEWKPDTVWDMGITESQESHYSDRWVCGLTEDDAAGIAKRWLTKAPHLYVKVSEPFEISLSDACQIARSQGGRWLEIETGEGQILAVYPL